jgi:hypothetical protein
VLIAGGTDSYGESASAELYDPADSSWSATGSMSTVRQSHTATLLPNGKVMVTGGNWMNSSSSNAIHSFAELYNPATEEWSITGMMATPRISHTATRLQNGNVLVAGGFDGTTVLASAELYNYLYTYTITTTAGTGGNISSNQVVIHDTDSAAVVITPNSGYHIATVLVDGVSQTVSDPSTYSHTFLSVTANHTVDATFAINTYSISVTFSGTGSGNVVSLPGGAISCPVGACNSNFNAGTNVTLAALPGTVSTFGGWSGSCTNPIGDCVFNAISSAKNVTATFTLLSNNAKNSGTGNLYGTLTGAYNAASEGDIIQAQSLNFIENLVLSRGIGFTLRGGYDDGSFTPRSGYTTIQGTVTLSGHGTVKMDRVIIK